MDFTGFKARAQLTGGRTRARTQVLLALALAGMFAIMRATAASSADLVGHVASDGGGPVAGVEISIADSSGAAAGSVVSDADGSYEIRGLKPGIYKLGLKGQSVMSYVPKEGLTVNWGLSKTAPPLAIAKLGASAVDSKVSKSK
jgi:Carboxypeptidase regulatory-like domain